MAVPKSKDLFDDSVMTFGEHLEELRTRLINSIYGLVLAMVITLFFGERIIVFIREPVDAALERMQVRRTDQKLAALQVRDDVKGYRFSESLWTWFKSQFWPTKTPKPKPELAPTTPESERIIMLELNARQLLQEFHNLMPDSFPMPPENLQEQKISVSAASDVFVDLRSRIKQINEPVTLNVQEAFFTYMKVAFISGLVLSSPWIFYQLWLFVAAGLYPHEQKYVYTFLPMSIAMFLLGAVFCFYGVFPTVLDFLLGFNERMGISAQLRISEYITFAVMLPLVFGISFQLPLVMLFLHKVSIMQVKTYREQRKMAILVIAILSMILTPTGDPWTLCMMMAPLVVLYEVGILLCVWSEKKSPFEAPATT